MAQKKRNIGPIRWLILGVVTTVAALWLTIPAVEVDLSNKPMVLATAFTSYGRDANTQFGFKETNEGIDLTVDFQLDGNAAASSRILLLSYVSSCSVPVKGATRQLTVAPSSAQPAFDTQNFQNAFMVSVPADVPSDAEILCHLNVKPLKATYSERRIAFARDVDLPKGTIGPGMTQTDGDVYLFQQPNAENLKVEHAQLMNGSLHQDNAYMREGGSDFNAVTMDWTDVHAERLHEFVYFIGAALIGLALSCFVEVARPWLSGGR